MTRSAASHERDRAYQRRRWATDPDYRERRLWQMFVWRHTSAMGASSGARSYLRRMGRLP